MEQSMAEYDAIVDQLAIAICEANGLWAELERSTSELNNPRTDELASARGETKG